MASCATSPITACTRCWYVQIDPVCFFPQRGCLVSRRALPPESSKSFPYLRTCTRTCCRANSRCTTVRRCGWSTSLCPRTPTRGRSLTSRFGARTTSQKVSASDRRAADCSVRVPRPRVRGVRKLDRADRASVIVALAAAVGRAFQDIYDNNHGSQDYLAQFWGKVGASLVVLAFSSALLAIASPAKLTSRLLLCPALRLMTDRLALCGPPRDSRLRTHQRAVSSPCTSPLHEPNATPSCRPHIAVFRDCSWSGDIFKDPALLLPGVAGRKNLLPMYNNLNAAIRKVRQLLKAMCFESCARVWL
jgi:hypothetical protein